MESVAEHRDIPYTAPDAPKDILRSLDLYLPPQPNSQLIVFVHGGAWRSEDKSVHVGLARRLAIKTSSTIAVPNYRLSSSPLIKHPVHTDDVQDALLFLSSLSSTPHSSSLNPSPPGLPLKFDSIWCIGHSAGGHILTTLVLSPPPSAPILREPTPPSLLHAIKGIICLEGIYDLDLLLKSFPSDFYRGFVVQAFGDKQSYANVDTTSFLSYGAEGDHIRWVIVHSSGDQLVDFVQAEKMYNRLVQITPSPTGNKLPNVLKDFTSFTQDHHELLESEELVSLVAKLVVSNNVV